MSGRKQQLKDHSGKGAKIRGDHQQLPGGGQSDTERGEGVCVWTQPAARRAGEAVAQQRQGGPGSEVRCGARG